MTPSAHVRVTNPVPILAMILQNSLNLELASIVKKHSHSGTYRIAKSSDVFPRAKNG